MCPFDYLWLFSGEKEGVRNFQILWLANMWLPLRDVHVRFLMRHTFSMGLSKNFSLFLNLVQSKDKYFHRTKNFSSIKNFYESRNFDQMNKFKYFHHKMLVLWDISANKFIQIYHTIGILWWKYMSLFIWSKFLGS